MSNTTVVTIWCFLFNWFPPIRLANGALALGFGNCSTSTDSRDKKVDSFRIFGEQQHLVIVILLRING